MAAPVNQNQSTISCSYNEEGWAAFVAEFLADDPDGYSVESGPKEGQIIISNVSKMFFSSTYISKYDCDSVSPMLANALLSLGRKATQVSQVEQENLHLKEQIALLKREIYGKSSEQQTAPEPDETTDRGVLGKAIHYAIEQWPAMMRYVDDGDLAIDNNIAEREIKQIVIGRKNWLFADTPDGAFTNATMYSLVQTAKANGLDPSAYLRHVFATLPNLKTAEEVKQLLPWNVQLAEVPASEIQLAA